MRYLIGVDAGGTKTIAVVYNMEGFRLAAFSTGPGNLTAGGDAARANLVGAVEGAMAALEKGRPSPEGRETPEGQKTPEGCFIGVGMAGFDPAVTPQAVKTLLEGRFGVPTVAVDDGQLALCAAHGLGDGIVVIAGTGSIAYGRHGKTLVRRGGWGHMLGDRGSGWSVAADALRLALDDEDEGRPMSELTRALLREAGKTRLRELVELTYREPKGALASLASAVAQRASADDHAAGEILVHAGAELAELAAGLAGRLGLVEPQVACGGSMLTHNEIVRTAFAGELKELCPGARVLTETLEPTRGALALYKAQEGA